MKFIKAELYKLSKLKKTYLALVGMNLMPIIILLISLYMVLFKHDLMKGSMGMSMMYSEKAKQLVTLIFFFEIFSISIASLLFMSLIIGELISKEFSSGTIKLLLTQPVKRSWLYIYKFASILLFYFLSVLTGYLIMALNGAIFYFVDKGFLGLLNYPAMLKVGLTFILLDISLIAYVSLVASFSPSIEVTISLSIVVYCMMRIFDGILMTGNKIQAFGEFAVKYAPYTYTNSAAAINPSNYEQIKDFIAGTSTAFPINTDLLFLNGGYTLLFFLAGMILFLKREN